MKKSTLTAIVLLAVTVSLLIAVIFLPAQALADDKTAGIHIQSDRRVSFTWHVNDGGGYQWPIQSGGYVSGGTNNAYSDGMTLQINGNGFGGGQGKLDKDGREVEIGPWQPMNQLTVYRRVYVDPKQGYCRWIDIFENGSTAKQTVTLQYYINLGNSVGQMTSTTGAGQVGEKDWGFVTSFNDGSSRPAIAHIFATKNSKVKPSVSCSIGNSTVSYTVRLDVPAGKSSAICFFESQMKAADSQKFLKDFNPTRELAKLPPGLRSIIANMAGATLTLGQLELPRSDVNDLAVLRNGDEVLGTLAATKYNVETFYGKLDLDAAGVVGLCVPAEDDPFCQVGLLDGQVVAGKLINAPLTMKLADGNQMSLTMDKLKTAAYKLSPQRPEEIQVAKPLVVLRAGERVFFKAADLDCTFHTEYGDLKLNPDDLRSIVLDTAENGLHRALFRNGSTLSGLMTAEDLKLHLDLGPTLSARRSIVERFDFPAADETQADVARVEMRNDDLLLGRITDKKLTVKTKLDTIEVASSDIAEAVFQQTSLGQVAMKLWSGTTVTGQLKDQTIHFQIEPGPEVAVFVGHITRMACPKPPQTPASGPTSGPTSGPATSPAPSPSVTPGMPPGLGPGPAPVFPGKTLVPGPGGGIRITPVPPEAILPIGPKGPDDGAPIQAPATGHPITPKVAVAAADNAAHAAPAAEAAAGAVDDKRTAKVAELAAKMKALNEQLEANQAKRDELVKLGKEEEAKRMEAMIDVTNKDLASAQDDYAAALVEAKRAAAKPASRPSSGPASRPSAKADTLDELDKKIASLQKQQKVTAAVRDKMAAANTNTDDARAAQRLKAVEASLTRIEAALADATAQREKLAAETAAK